MTGKRIARTPAACSTPLLIGSLLETGVARAAQEQIVYADRRLTYREFGERVGRLAAALAGLGVKPGDTVGVMDWDTHRYLECYFAVPMMGAVLLTINVRLSPEQILYTINDAEAAVILVNAAFLPILELEWERVAPGKKLVLLNDLESAPETPLPLCAEYEAMLADADPSFRFPELDEDTLATVFYTTGTTGLPKGVSSSHRQLVLHTLAIRAALTGPGHGRFNEGGVYMPLTPMFHVHAWGMPYLATMLGVKQVYPGHYVADALVELVQRERVTFSHCVPTILRMVLASARSKGVTFSGWSVVIGGSAMPQELARQALQLGVDVFGGYGMSETCPVLTLARLTPEAEAWEIDRQLEVRCKAGRPIPMVQLRIVDEAMNDLPHDNASQGEVVARAPWLTQGYWHDAQSSEMLWSGGWLHTGDLGVMDEQGYLRITDRIKDVIKTGGEWVSSLDLENLIAKHSGVAEVAVIGVPDPKWTERPLAVVVAKPGNETTEAGIKALLGELVAEGVIPRYWIPEHIVLAEALPRTSVGKIDKKALRRMYGTS
jgi:fatty-acyl-CoA synthase